METYNFQRRRKSREKWGLRCVKGRLYNFVCMSCVKKGTIILKRQLIPHLQLPCSQTAWPGRNRLEITTQYIHNQS